MSIPLSYVTGTLVKMGQGIERHISGGQLSDWLGYFMLWAGFAGGAIVGGFISYPLAGVGALIIGLVESFSAFYSSAFKDAIVFGVLIPVVLIRWLSTRSEHDEVEEEEL